MSLSKFSSVSEAMAFRAKANQVLRVVGYASVAYFLFQTVPSFVSASKTDSKRKKLMSQFLMRNRGEDFN
ncbi:hypothetical protein RchiOBHm_Chr5g0006991 [Rosa chinensis]|uniref:Uncharacterized protein n=1 Tax=Rosa chinensis TaxID=74649 RepID=A0A2P6Q3T8_ROSCH|nr:hypothetical protein RchiOBHm_Chr5g0006991 [Rosa chinensis]